MFFCFFHVNCNTVTSFFISRKDWKWSQAFFTDKAKTLYKPILTLTAPSWCSIASIQQSLFYSRKSGYFRYDFQSSWLDDRYKCIRVFGIFSLCKQLLKPNEVQKFFKRGEKQVLFLPTARRLVLQLLELVSKGSPHNKHRSVRQK